jgi:hypothetical protein
VEEEGMNKKGQAFVSIIIMITIAIVFVAYLSIPQIQESGDFDFSESIVKTNATANETFTLAHFPVIDFSISGLTETTNYTLTDATGVLILNNETLNTTYTAVYNYEGSRYIDSSTDRALFFVLITIFIVGIVYKGAEMFGLV